MTRTCKSFSSNCICCPPSTLVLVSRDKKGGRGKNSNESSDEETGKNFFSFSISLERLIKLRRR